MIGKSAKTRRKPVLRKVSGAALPHEVLAIMGSSGAGKTTLMNILAFQSSKEVEISGAILVNGRAMTKQEMRSMSAYVQQIDLFCGTLTISGAILVNGRAMTKQEMRSMSAYVQQIDLFCGTLTVREQLTYSVSFC
ncbi:unnamed protein product [Strongylus vulgaris]|uniref:ABC transporter domain-containing protein n=1 Tax=Strongylus vulgaris TaxID=40348 RepID=A0A3P7JIC8_STRVU|nr:unnamed protein product [Strongylus vulgaris]